MIDPATFFKALGISVVFVSLLAGVGYWIRTVFKANPNLKFWVKYKVLRRKHNTEDVAMLLEDIEAGVNEGELYKAIILTNKASPQRAMELLYIYKELKKIQMKGGIKNE